MKKLISGMLSLIIFISLIGLILIININGLLKYKTIEKVTSKIKYLDLVNIEMNENELKEAYDSIYISFQQEGMPGEIVDKVYEQDFFKKVMAKIIYIESNYLLTGNTLETYTIDELNKLIVKDINKLDNIDDNERKVIINIMSNNSSKILTMENIIRSNINNIAPLKIEFIRYVLGDKFKIILLSLIIIAILLLFFINREKVFPYIFIPTIICSVFFLVISIFTSNLLVSFISNEFLEGILYPFIKLFLGNLLFTALILLGVSIIYLMMNEMITVKEKSKIRPKIKNKGIIGI